MDDSIQVKHFVLCRNAEVVGEFGFFDAYHLSSVNYRFRVSSELGMSAFDPLTVPKVDLFTRFYGGRDSADFEMEFRWLEDSPIRAPDPSELYGPFTVYFRENEPSRDFVFRVRNVPLFGTGRYAFILRQLSDTIDEDDEPLAVEYFEVVQS